MGKVENDEIRTLRRARRLESLDTLGTSSPSKRPVETVTNDGGGYCESR